VIDPRSFKPLALGSVEIARLLPHRPPLLLVDAVEALSTDPAALRAHKLIDPSEPVLAGHFPGRPLWPGAYTIEGLAQCCALLGALLRTHGADPSATPAEGHPGMIGVLAQVDVKLTRPVLPGQRLEYVAVRTHVVGPVHRFEVEASVGNRSVARGTLSCALMEAR
jgi:3-hydroxyacyl-[acyl-carrier-protein] dehydratase